MTTKTKTTTKKKKTSTKAKTTKKATTPKTAKTTVKTPKPKTLDELRAELAKLRTEDRLIPTLDLEGAELAEKRSYYNNAINTVEDKIRKMERMKT